MRLKNKNDFSLEANHTFYIMATVASTHEHWISILQDGNESEQFTLIVSTYCNRSIIFTEWNVNSILRATKGGKIRV